MHPLQVMKECLVAAEIGQFVPDDRLQRLLRLVHHSMGIRSLFSRLVELVEHAPFI